MVPRWFRLPSRSRSDAREAVDEELAFHLERAVEEKVAGGMDPEQARRDARAEFGDVAGTADYCTHHTVRGRRHATRLHLPLRGRRALVVGQVAIAIVLITGAGLMVRSFQRLEAMALGFDAERVLTVEAALPATPYPVGEDFITFFRRAARRTLVPGLSRLLRRDGDRDLFGPRLRSVRRRGRGPLRDRERDPRRALLAG